MLLRRAISLFLASFLFFAGNVHAHARFDHGKECSACIIHAGTDVAPPPGVVPLPLVVEITVHTLPEALPDSRPAVDTVFETGPPVA